MKWHYASLSEYPQTANACLVETPDVYRVMWYSNMDKRWYSDADKQYSDDDPYNCFKWVYIDEILEAMIWGGNKQRELPTEREEFESNCVYVILFHDYYNLRKCICLSDEEYRLKHAAIVEMFSECGRIETHVYVEDKKE